MYNSLAKKIFAVGIAASTVLMAMAPFAAQAAAHAAGTNVKASDGTIFMITTDGQRRPYTSAGAFLSYGFNSFASTVIANADDLALPQGSYIPPQDGSIFCATETKASDVKGECALITGGLKAAFTSASVFTGLGFSFSHAQSGDSSFLNKTANVDNTTAAHLPGVLVNNNGTVQLIGANGILGIPDLATFNSWGYSFGNVVPANAADKALSQTGVMAARIAGQLSPTFTTGGNPPPVSSGAVSVSLASDSPAAQTIAVSGTNDASHAGNTTAALAKFAFSGTGTVTQIVLKRTGVSGDTIVPNVYLFNGDTRLTDAASIGGSSLITFNNPSGLFSVNGSMTVTVVGELLDTASAGSTVGLQLTSYTVTGGSAATVAVSGSTMTIAQASDLAYANFGSVTPSVTTSVDPSKDVEVFHSNVSVNQRDMTLSRFILRNTGSAQAADINNFRLRIDGNQVAQTANMDNGGYVTFSFSPVTLKSGTRIFSVMADIVGGSSRNFAFQIRNKADVNFVDTQYNVATSPSTSTSFPVVAAPDGDDSTIAINSGTMTLQKDPSSPSADLINDASDVVLAKYTVTAYGEPMKIETVNAAATSSVGFTSLRNGRVLINGAQYGSNAALLACVGACATTGGTQYTVNYTVNPGTPVILEVRADLHDTGSVSLSGKTVTGYIMAGSNNVQRLTSLGYTSVPTTNSKAGNTLSIVTGSMSIVKNGNYSGQTTPLPQTAYKVGSFNLVGSSAEDININTLDLSINKNSSKFDYSDLTSVQVKIAGNLFGTTKSTLSSATSTFSGSYSLKQNTTVAVDIFADLGVGESPQANTDYVQAVVGVSGTTANSAASVSSAATGQQITYGAGSLTITKDASSPSAALVSDNQTKTNAVYKFKAESGSFTVKEVVVTFTAGAPTSVNNVILKDGSTVLATKPGGTSSVTFSGLDIPVDSNTTKLLTVDLEIGQIGVGAGTSNETLTTDLSSIKYTNSSGTQTTDTSSVPTGSAMYAFAALPTVTNVALPDGTLGAGTKTIAKFTISSNGTGTVAWNKIIFSVSDSVHPTLNSFSLVNADTNEAVLGTFASSTDFGNADAAGHVGTVTFTVSNASNGGQEEITSKTYALKAVVGGTGIAAGDFVTVSIAQGQTGHGATATSTAIPETETFAWSDESASAHATSTSDWFGDWLVRNIPTDSQSMTK